MLESGPAAGVVGAQALCRELQLNDAVAFDMGGTTAKAGVIYHGEVLTATTALIGGYNEALPIQIPMVHISEVGTGGGSIAAARRGGRPAGRPAERGSRSRSGLLRARWHPSYGDRREPRPRPARGRPLPRRRDEARRGGGARAIEACRKAAGLVVGDAAAGILRIAASSMSYAVKGVSTERGLDAAAFALIAYGGAGLARLADRARDRHVAHHRAARAGPFLRLRHAAFGPALRLRAHLVHAPGGCAVRRHRARLRRAGRAGEEGARGKRRALRAHHDRLRRRHALRRPGAPGDGGPLIGGLQEAQTATRSSATSTRCTLCATAPTPPEERAEIVSLRHGDRADEEAAPGEDLARRGTPPSGKAAFTGAACSFDDRKTADPAYARRSSRRQPHRRPGAVEEHASTTVLLPGDRMKVDGYGNLVIEVGKR